MPLEVSINEAESQESLLRRFQRMVQTSEVLREVKAHRHFLSRGERHVSKRNRAPGVDDIRLITEHDNK